MDNEEFIKEFPLELQNELEEDLENIEEGINELEEDLTKDAEEIKNPVGRPLGIPASNAQKMAVSKAAKEYQKKVRDGLIEKPEWETHGAYSYMSNNRVPKKKRYLLEFVHKERTKWLSDLGGEDNLSSIEISLLDEACRLLLFATMVNDHLLSDKDMDVVYTDKEGDTKMHSGLSRHYLSFTKTYISILKELQKLTTSKKGKKSGVKKDSASILQKLYRE